MLKTSQERSLDLAGSECELPNRKREWLPETLLTIDELYARLYEPTRDLLDQLEADQPDAFESIQESAGRFHEAEELLRLLRDFGDANAFVTGMGQLAYRLEQALSRLNFLIGGLVASDAASYLDLVHLKRELQTVWNVLRGIDKKLNPFALNDETSGGEAS